MTERQPSLDDHVSRYCKPSTIEDGEVQATAFQVRENEDYLSVNWLEYFGIADLEAAINLVREALEGKNFSVRPNGRFAVLQVGSIITAISESHGRFLRIEHRPTSDDRSHAGILGFTVSDLAIATELCALVDTENLYAPMR